MIPAYEFMAPRDTGLPEAFGRRQREQLDKIARIIDEGKAQGSIREDVDSLRTAWRLIVFAWAEDIAEMMGIHEFIGEGISTEILDVLLKDLGAGVVPSSGTAPTSAVGGAAVLAARASGSRPPSGTGRRETSRLGRGICGTCRGQATRQYPGRPAVAVTLQW